MDMTGVTREEAVLYLLSLQVKQVFFTYFYGCIWIKKKIKGKAYLGTRSKSERVFYTAKFWDIEKGSDQLYR